MPQVDGGQGVGFKLGGVYAILLRAECKQLTAPDARLFFTDPDGLERLKADAAQRAELMFGERLEAGEPIVLPRLKFGGRSIPRRDDWTGVVA